jgi:uncharacterized membrane-anchored protein YhcB (DUF1043 family)
MPDFSWIKEPTIIAALIVALIIIVLLIRFLFSMWKKFEENRISVNSTILDLSNRQTAAAEEHTKQMANVIDKVNTSIQQMTLATSSATEINKGVKESTDENTKATRELKDFLTDTVIKVLQNKL